MIGPRDHPPAFGVPVHPDTGMPLTERQQHHLDAISVGAEALFTAMHAADGSTPPGEHQDHTWSGRRMNIAAMHIETALFYAHRAVLEVP